VSRQNVAFVKKRTTRTNQNPCKIKEFSSCQVWHVVCQRDCVQTTREGHTNNHLPHQHYV